MSNHTHTHTHTRIHSHMRVIVSVNRGRAIDDICESVCLCKGNYTEDAKLNTWDAQLGFHVLSRDKYSGNRGRKHLSYTT